MIILSFTIPPSQVWVYVSSERKNKNLTNWALWCIPVSLPSSHWLSLSLCSLIGGNNGSNQNTALSLVHTKWLPADSATRSSLTDNCLLALLPHLLLIPLSSFLLTVIQTKTVRQFLSEKVQDGVRHQADGHLQESAERFDPTNSDGGGDLHMLRPLHHLHARHRASLLCQPRRQVRAASGK